MACSEIALGYHQHVSRPSFHPFLRVSTVQIQFFIPIFMPDCISPKCLKPGNVPASMLRALRLE